MPWKYIRFDDTTAADHRDAVLERSAQFWREFDARLRDIELSILGQSQWNASEWLATQIAGLDQGLSVASGASPEGGFWLALSTGDLHTLRPMLRDILAAAPTLPNWRWLDGLPPVPTEEVATRLNADIGRHLGFFTVHPQIGADHRIDLMFQTKLAETDPKEAERTSIATARALLGETIFHQWIGDIEAQEISHTADKNHFILPQRLLPVTESLIAAIREKLPPYHYYEIAEKSLKSTSFKRDLRPAADYAGQDDLEIGNCVIKEFRSAVESGRPFYSSSFSRLGEQFCYLKVDADSLSQDERFIRKQKLEEAIDRSLRRNKAARIIGGGAGMRYIYFDVCISNLDETLDIVSNRWAALDLPQRSWLLFHDAEMADEYVGLAPGAGEPPRKTVGEPGEGAVPKRPTFAEEVPAWGDDPIPPV